MKKFLLSAVSLFLACALQSLNAATLVGWAEMRTATYSFGPTAYQFGDKSRVEDSKQAVQGFSAVLKADAENSYYFLTDNGFGRKDNSADALIRLYEVEVDFNEAKNKNNQVIPIQFINLNDADKKLSFEIQADYSHYYKNTNNPVVDPSIKQARLLTGADIDTESVRLDKNGHFWFGDEFGPYLIKTDTSGKVLRQEIQLPNVYAPENPNLKNSTVNIDSSAGFEGMAINPSGDTLYPMLEGTVHGDPKKSLRIYQFDINKETFSPTFYRYQLDAEATNIGDFVAVNEQEFLVIERNAADEHAGVPYKKIYLINIGRLNPGDFVKKQLLVDLMDIKDPNDLNQDTNTHFTFPFVTIENILILSKDTLLVANDNNYSERTNFIKIRLNQSLNVVTFVTPKINKKAWTDSKHFLSNLNFGDHSFFGWATVLMYLLAVIRTGYKAKITYNNKENYYFWVGLTGLLIFLGLNKQLDLQSNLTEWLRASAKANGWYEQRRAYQLLFVSIMGLAIPILLISLRLFLYHSWQRHKLTWLGIILLLLFVLVRAASFHHVDTIFYQTIGSIRYYQATEILAIALIILGTIYHKEYAQPFATSAKGIRDYVEIAEDGDDVRCPRCGVQPLSEPVEGRLFKCRECSYKYRVLVQNS